MGNKNKSRQKENINQENRRVMEDLVNGITKYLKSDKTTNECLTDINKLKNFINKPKKVQKSNLKENLESNNIYDFCLDLTSCLINKSLNHEVNTTFYKSLLISKVSENNSDSEILNQQNNMMINWIYKTLLSEKAGKYDNWVPDIKENNWLNKLNHVSSIHANSDVNASSYQLSDRNLSIEENKKIKRNNFRSGKSVNNNFNERGLPEIVRNINEKIVTAREGIKLGRTLSAGLIDKDNLQNLGKKNNNNNLSKKPRFYSPTNKAIKSSGFNILKSIYNNTSPANDVSKKKNPFKKQNDDQKTVNSLLYHMNRNGEFSSSKKENRLKVLDSINKALNVKKPSEEFNISLNTLNTKNSGTLANMHSSGKSKALPDKMRNNEDDKIIELYKMNPNLDLDFHINDNKNSNTNERNDENFNTKLSPLDSNQNQTRNLTSLNNEKNIKNFGNINLTAETHNQITSNINKTQITGMTMKNNYLKSNHTPNSLGNNNNNKNKFNLINHTQNRISEHMEESKKYDSIRSKIPINKINSKSFSKNKTNNAKEDNLNLKKFESNNSNEKSKLVKKSSEVKNNNDNNKGKNKIQKNNSKIKIFSNENVLNYNPKNLNSINRINSGNNLNNKFSPNNNLRTSNSRKNDFIRVSSKDILQSKESDLAEFILNNVEPLKLNDYKDLSKTEAERNKKTTDNDLNTNINGVNLKGKPKTAANDHVKNNEANNLAAAKKNNSSSKNAKKAGKSIKIDIRDLLSGDEDNNQAHYNNAFKRKDDFNVYRKYKKPTRNDSRNLKIIIEDKNKKEQKFKKNNEHSNLKSNIYANTEENYPNDKWENSLGNLRELYENPISKTKLSQHQPLKKDKLAEHLKKNQNQKSNFKRLNFHDNANISDILADLEKKEKKINKENANTQKIINLKDYIMKLDIPKYNIDLKPLEYDLPYNEILKHFKENNKFLFEMTNEEKELNDKLKAFNYVSFDETVTDTIKVNKENKDQHEYELNKNLNYLNDENNKEVNSSKITNSVDIEINSSKKTQGKINFK